jgi:predicted small lipoprotein YifL
MSRFVALTAAPVARLGAFALVAMGVAGCGQKGPLYLPDKNGSVVTRPGAAQTPSQTSPTPAPKKKDDDSGTPAPPK